MSYNPNIRYVYECKNNAAVLMMYPSLFLYFVPFKSHCEELKQPFQKIKL